MDIEKIESIGFIVADLDESIKRFSYLFGIDLVAQTLPDDFEVERLPTEYPDKLSLGTDGAKFRLAIDPTGYFELLEGPPSMQGFRNVHLKVRDIEAAKQELIDKGMHLVSDARIGRMREAVFDAADLYGIRLCLLQYDGPSLIQAMNATLGD